MTPAHPIITEGADKLTFADHVAIAEEHYDATATLKTYDYVRKDFARAYAKIATALPERRS